MRCVLPRFPPLQIDLDTVSEVLAANSQDLPFTGVALNTPFGGWLLCPEPDEDGSDTYLPRPF